MLHVPAPSPYRLVRALIVAVLFAGLVQRAHAVVGLELAAPGVSFDQGRLLIALPVQNGGDSRAINVRVVEAHIDDGRILTRIAPSVRLGDIGPEERSILNLEARLERDGDERGDRDERRDREKRRLLTIEGLYSDPSLSRDPRNNRHFRLRIEIELPVAAPGSATVSSRAIITQVTSGPYPAVPQPPQGKAENEDLPPTPIGPLRFPFPATPAGTAPKPLPFTSYPGTAGSGSAAVSFVRNSGQNGTNAKFPPDPSAAASGAAAKLVIATGNLYVKYSIDGGGSFTTISDLSTVFGDSPDGGYCCDQVVHYIPSIDRIVWLIQTNQPTDAANNPTGPNALRVAWAKPADVVANFNTAWTWVDLRSSFLGFGNDWLDFPDLSTSGGFLYASVDDVTRGGLVVARISFADLAKPGGNVITVEWTDPANGKEALASHLVQNAAGTMYWAGHTSTSKLRIFSWADNSAQYSWTEREHNGYANTDYTSKAPDGQYWFAPKPKGDAITGAVRKPFFGLIPPGGTAPPNELWFAWNAARDTNFKQPYIRIVKVAEDTLNPIGIHDIWNDGFAFAYPALAANRTTGEVAISLMWGGGASFLNHAVGFPLDFVMWITTASDVTFTADPTKVTPPGSCPDASAGATPGRCTRSGDYLSTRRVGDTSGLFGTLGYEVKLVDPTKSKDCLSGPGCRQDVRYVEFGRPEDTSTEPPPTPIK
jgi:hypothetical protein